MLATSGDDPVGFARYTFTPTDAMMSHMGLEIFLLVWVLSGGVCFVGLYYALNKGYIESLPEYLEPIVNEPIGILAIFVMCLVMGPVLFTSMRIKLHAKINRRKPDQPVINVKTSVSIKDPDDEE